MVSNSQIQAKFFFTIVKQIEFHWLNYLSAHDRSMSKSELLKLEEQEAKTKKGGAKPGAVKKGKK